MAVLPIPDGYRVGERISGIINTRGAKAGIEQNWGYHAVDPSGEACILLYCNPGVFAIIDSDALEQLRTIHDKQVSWYQMQTGYAACHVIQDGISTCLTMHQVLMNYYGHGKGGLSIDHINSNKLDNRISNLRLATQSEQIENRGKLSRKYNAKELPAGLEQSDLPKFVIYYHERHGNAMREFFTVEKHPIQNLKAEGVQDHRTAQLANKRWATTKAKDVSICDKLQQAIEYIAFLDAL
jgi:hypothetical protein